MNSGSGILNSVVNLAKAGASCIEAKINEMTKRINMSEIQNVDFNNIKVVEKTGELTVLPKGGNIQIANVVFGIGLGWNPAKTGVDFDLDASALLLTDDKKPATNTPVIYYGVKEDSRNSIRHSGDNLTGEGNGDDELILVDCAKLDPTVNEIDVIVNIYKAAERRQNFGQVSDAYVRLFDITTGEVFVRYDLSEDYSMNSGVFVGKIYKHNDQWKFKAVGAGVNGEIADIARQVVTL